jgi:hypothetical protein
LRRIAQSSGYSNGIGRPRLARERHARQRLGAVGGVQQEGRHDHRRLAQVLGLHVVVGVDAGVVEAAAIIERVLDELVAGMPTDCM